MDPRYPVRQRQTEHEGRLVQSQARRQDAVPQVMGRPSGLGFVESERLEATLRYERNLAPILRHSLEDERK